MRAHYLLVIVFLWAVEGVNGQQLDQVGKKGGIKVNGGVNVNQVFRDNVGTGVDPYSIVLSGQLSTSLYGMSIPLSFTWSNSQWTYTQPFNQFSLSPSYKWATLHLGWSSMSFSPYSLSGHTFSGAGVELNPGDKFSFSAMYGRLRKELKGDTIHGYDPQYKRMGTGMKGEYRFKFGEVGMHVFYGGDDTRKPVEQIDSLGITPMENMVLGTTFTLRPYQRLSVRGEFNVSSLSHDRRISRATDWNGPATFRYHAAKSDIAWNTSLGSIGAGMEYVEPGYNTLGAYYTVNDFVNYTVNLATVMLQGRINLAANVGIRETNLDNQSDTDQQDVVKNINIGFTPGEKLNFNLSYSNFYNYTFVRTLFEETNAHTEYELMDTVKFTQINENISLSGNWRLKETEQVKHNLNANINWQQATQNQSDTPENADSRFINASGGYMWSRPKQGFSAGLNMNYSRNKASEVLGEAYGPMLFVRKSMFDKTWRNSLSVSWNGTYQDGVSTGNVMTARLGSNYAFKKKHLFNLSVAYSHRKRNGSGEGYLTATLGYSYSFGWPKKEGKE
ncbi:hypothetical protein DMA11_11955 [Marinilabiliaceae bacterium JC017]|nr:hypothetical protein DMA11_11955 [Marinilabiliaceae bacterium JC017]